MTMLDQVKKILFQDEAKQNCMLERTEINGTPVLKLGVYGGARTRMYLTKQQAEQLIDLLSTFSLTLK